MPEDRLISDRTGSAVTRCTGCGYVGTRTFARDVDGRWRDVLGGPLGVCPEDCICSYCGKDDFEMVPIARGGEAPMTDQPKLTVHPLLGWISGMCTDERPYTEIDHRVQDAKHHAHLLEAERDRLVAEVERLQRIVLPEFGEDDMHRAYENGKREAGAEIEGLREELHYERDDVERLREAASAIYRRHGGTCPMGSWWSPGHDVIRAEWEALRDALALDEEDANG